MDSPGGRTVSGRALVVVAVLLVSGVVSAGVLLGPQLREDVRQEQQPRTLREPVAAGEHGGQAWEAVGRYDGEANCVELRYLGEVLGRACDTGPTLTQTRIPPDGPVVAYGVVDETQTSVSLTLDDGAVVQAPAEAGDLGFPVSFWAAQLPAGRRVDAVT